MSVILSSSVTKAIDDWLVKYPSDQKQAAVIFALMKAQEANKGHLTEGLLAAVAAYLDMPKIAVYEVASFYTLFELAPVGMHKISLCTNISCHLRNSEEIYEYLKARLGIEFNQTTPDGRFTLKEVECLAACGGAPAMQIGRQYHEQLTVEKVEAIVSELERGNGQ